MALETFNRITIIAIKTSQILERNLSQPPYKDST
jgi:hypothetical protein